MKNIGIGVDKMKNLYFRNITSDNRRQRILSSSELSESAGMRTAINRHLVCRIYDVEKAGLPLPRPTLYVLKKQDKKEKVEIFYCRIKGSMYFALKNKLCLISFINSLRIQLSPSYN